MTQGNIVYIQQTGIDRLRRSEGKLDASGCRQSTQITATPIRGFTAYEPAIPRCKTCAHFTESTIVESGYCHVQLGTVPRPVPLDGSGYCHRHEVVW